MERSQISVRKLGQEKYCINAPVVFNSQRNTTRVITLNPAFSLTFKHNKTVSACHVNTAICHSHQTSPAHHCSFSTLAHLFFFAKQYSQSSTIFQCNRPFYSYEYKDIKNFQAFASIPESHDTGGKWFCWIYFDRVIARVMDHFITINDDTDRCNVGLPIPTRPRSPKKHQNEPNSPTKEK